ncbi:hypothetical protein V6N12_013784 [Hibiscus sabdariffa]|uniref:Uncharacterized protein n=1 Tax=Hibiscus sabdariffa TaxID=183260 RepID=A0ABR2CV63_9ROSI
MSKTKGPRNVAHFPSPRNKQTKFEQTDPVSESKKPERSRSTRFEQPNPASETKKTGGSGSGATRPDNILTRVRVEAVEITRRPEGPPAEYLPRKRAV